MYYQKPYYLGPDKGGEKGYALLVRAMERAKKVAVAEFVMRGKEYLSVIRPYGEGAMCLETLRYGNEVIAPDEIEDETGGSAKLNERELKMAEQLVGSLATSFDPSRYHDEYRKCVMDLVERKAEGQSIVLHPAPARKATPPKDLTEVLKASLAHVRQQQHRHRRKSA
jgi:DNA end-binding protein Ku